MLDYFIIWKERDDKLLEMASYKSGKEWLLLAEYKNDGSLYIIDDRRNKLKGKTVSIKKILPEKFIISHFSDGQYKFVIDAECPQDEYGLNILQDMLDVVVNFNNESHRLTERTVIGVEYELN